MKRLKRLWVLCLILSLLTLVSCETRDSTVTGGVGTQADRVQKAPPESSDGSAVKIPAKNSLTVIIDPGHGFDDPGSQPEFLRVPEAEITLRAANTLKRVLEEKGIFAILTHDGETFPSVSELCAMADSYGVEYEKSKMTDNNIFGKYERVVYENVLAAQFPNCVFVSLHSNSFEDSSVQGLSIDYHENNPNAELLQEFSEDFRDAIDEEFGSKVTIFADSFDMALVVTKYTDIPSVLIEMGYGSNKHDAENLQSEEWTEAFCEVLADCITDNFKK